MTGDKRPQQRLGELLRTSKVAIALEIVLVLLPMTLGLVLSSRIGSDTISLGEGVTLLGGPLLYLGLVLSLLILWLSSKLRGAGWGAYGLSRPKSWIRTVLMALGVALAVLAAVKIAIDPLLGLLPNLPPRDMSRFEVLVGNLPNLIIQLLIIWITAGFVEELLFRAYLMPRLVDLQGKRTRVAWAISLVVAAIIFGAFHSYQAPIGMIRTGAIGLVFGLAYLILGRKLWPLVLAHGLIDSIDMVGHYFGG